MRSQKSSTGHKKIKTKGEKEKKKENKSISAGARGAKGYVKLLVGLYLTVIKFIF